MRCAHCDEPLPRSTRNPPRVVQGGFPCVVHGHPGKALPRGVPRCTVCKACHDRQVSLAPPDGAVELAPGLYTVPGVRSAFADLPRRGRK